MKINKKIELMEELKRRVVDYKCTICGTMHSRGDGDFEKHLDENFQIKTHPVAMHPESKGSK